VHAPEVIVLEAVNALRGLVRGGKLDPGVADDAVASLLELRVELHGHLALAVWNTT